MTPQWQRWAGWGLVLNCLVVLPLVLGAETGSELKIGLLAPPQEADAASVRQGATLGIEWVNRLAGEKAQLVIRGRPGQWGTEGDEAAVLGLDEGVGAIIAPPGGSASHQVMQIAGRTRIPVATLCSDSSVSGSGIPWVVRVVPRSDLEAETIFRGVTNAMGVARWAALVPEGRAGREGAKDLKKAAEIVGCTLTEPVKLSTREEDWGRDVQKALANRPGGILLWVDSATAARLARFAREGGFRGLLAGPSRLRSSAFVRNAGKAAEGCFIPTMVGPETSSNQLKSFAEAYRKQFGNEPDFMATAAADSVMLLAQLLRGAGEQPPYRLFPLKQEFSGITGQLRFDKDGNRLVSLGLMICREGEFKPFLSESH